MNTTYRKTHSPLAWLAVAMLVFSGTLPAQVIPGRYIAVLKQDTRDTPGAAKALAAQHNLEVDHVYTKALKGFAFNGSEQAAVALARRAEIAYLEPDQVCTAAQQTVPTGIRRSAAAAVPGLIGSGLMVDADVAVIDTGLDGTHPDLNVMPGGVRFYTVYDKKGRPIGLASDSNWQDDNGHGTHVGGIIGALDNDIGVVGVAPGVRLWPVKVLDASGAGTASTVIAGIDWVVQRAATFEVADLSLTMSHSQAVNDAVKAGTQAGIVFVVAAGDNWWDAASYSPASEPTALTVSALVDTDGLPGGLGGISSPVVRYYCSFDDWLFFYSNCGPAVDVCAPGGLIYSTFLISQGGYNTLTGTSMAAAHAAGASALYIARHGLTKTAEGVEAVCTAIRDSGWQPGHYASLFESLYNEDPYHEPLLNVARLVYANAPAALNLVTPTDATKVTGSTPVQVMCDVPGVTAVRFYLDGSLIGEDGNGADGWGMIWDTTTRADGPCMLAAVATDDTAQLAGDAILLGINNAAGTVPWVILTSPYWEAYYAEYLQNEEIVQGELELRAQVVDLGSVSAVQFYCGETFLGDGQLQPTGEWTLWWDSATVPDGITEMIAVAIGAGGSVGMNVPTPIKVINQNLHLAGLEISGVWIGSKWQATVRLIVHDRHHQPVAGAAVAGRWGFRNSWSNPMTYLTATPQVTDANGVCVFTSNLISKNVFYVSFTVTGVTPPSELEGVLYAPELNHNAEGNPLSSTIGLYSP